MNYYAGPTNLCNEVRMNARVRVGIMGAGSIGCFLGGMLATDKSIDVVLVGRERVGAELAEQGLHLQDLGGKHTTVSPERFAFATDVTALRDCQVVMCCVKSAHTEDVAKDMARVLSADTVVVSMQNGVRNVGVLRRHLEERDVLPGIVDFNVVSQGEGRFQRTMDGPLRTATCDAANWRRVVAAIRSSGLTLLESTDLQPEQWTKLLLNLNNAVSALSGAATPVLLQSAEYRRIVAAILEEGIGVLRAGGIKPAKLRGIPVAWMPKILRMPTPIVRLVTRAQMNVDPEARSSMWEDLVRGRPTEVEYLNGEVVALAKQHGVPAPVNERVVALVHEAERAAAGSPQYSGAALWAAIAASPGSK